MSAVDIAYGGSTGRTPASTAWGLYLPFGGPLDFNEIDAPPAHSLGWDYLRDLTSSTTAWSAVPGSAVTGSAVTGSTVTGSTGAAQPASAASASGYSVIDPSRRLFDPSSDQIHRLASKLKSYAGFTANWDGDGASSPDKEAINAALKFLTFVPEGAGVPNVMLLASGEPAFYWEFDDVYAEIGFDPQDQFYAYAEKPGWAPIHMDDIPIKQGFPEKVFEVLRGDQLQIAAE